MRRSTVAPASWLACWLILGLAARVFVPSGFMVGPISGGWPVAPCPGQSHGEHLAGEAAGHERDVAGHEQHEESCDSHCYLGYFFALAAETDVVDLTPVLLPETQSPVEVATPVTLDRGWSSAQPRGPPLSVSATA